MSETKLTIDEGSPLYQRTVSESVLPSAAARAAQRKPKPLLPYEPLFSHGMGRRLRATWAELKEWSNIGKRGWALRIAGFFISPFFVASVWLAFCMYWDCGLSSFF